MFSCPTVEILTGGSRRRSCIVLILQRHFQNSASEVAFIVAATGLSLALASPVGPLQLMLLALRGEQQHPQQAPHFRCGEGDQAPVIPPFPPLGKAAGVTARKAWASRHSVICRCHPSQRRTSY